MRRALIGLTALGFGLALSLISAPPSAVADTNGICLINGQPLISNPTDGSPILPNCSPDRRLQVMTAPDPSASPMRVQVISLPSSAPINGAVTVQNPGAFPSPIPFPTSYAINNYPSTQNVNVLNPSAFPSPIPFPAVQPVSGSVSVLNFPNPVPAQTFPASFSVSNFPTPTPQATQAVVQLPANMTILSAAGTTVVNNTPTTFLGVSDVSTSAQITAVTCYNNATTNSGTVFLNTTLGLTNPWFPSGGIALTNGLTCNVPLSLLGNGVAIYWRKT